MALVSHTENLVVERDGGRIYHVRGLNRFSSSRMKVTLRAERNGASHVDCLDLYLSKRRDTFASQIADLFSVSHETAMTDLSEVIVRCEKAREDAVKELREDFFRETPPMTKQSEAIGMGLLADPNLMTRITDDLGTIGYIGEAANKALAYLVAISRKLDSPLSCIIISRSGAGKSALLEVIEQTTPPEDVICFSGLTAAALYYCPAEALKHKLLSIEERVGAVDADYSIRQLQSKKMLRRGLPLRDPVSGKMQTFCIEVEGPVSVMESTTNPDINPENENRCIILHVDESSEQTVRIHLAQRRAATFGGVMRNRQAEEIIIAHHAAQRLLKSLPVVIPFAEKMSFPTARLRYRRDHGKFLTLIQSSALLHQYQRPQREVEIEGQRYRYIEATSEDYRIAHGLLNAICQHFMDDLSPMARRLYGEIQKRVPVGGEFTRREMREATGWGNDQIKRYFRELEDYEHIEVEKAGRGGRNRYRIGDIGLPALSNIEELRSPESFETRKG